jgi:hypothetical protein
LAREAARLQRLFFSHRQLISLFSVILAALAIRLG